MVAGASGTLARGPAGLRARRTPPQSCLRSGRGPCARAAGARGPALRLGGSPLCKPMGAAGSARVRAPGLRGLAALRSCSLACRQRGRAAEAGGAPRPGGETAPRCSAARRLPGCRPPPWPPSTAAPARCSAVCRLRRISGHGADGLRCSAACRQPGREACANRWLVDSSASRSAPISRPRTAATGADGLRCSVARRQPSRGPRAAVGGRPRRAGVPFSARWLADSPGARLRQCTGRGGRVPGRLSLPLGGSPTARLPPPGPKKVWPSSGARTSCGCEDARPARRFADGLPKCECGAHGGGAEAVLDGLPTPTPRRRRALSRLFAPPPAAQGPGNGGSRDVGPPRAAPPHSPPHGGGRYH